VIVIAWASGEGMAGLVNRRMGSNMATRLKRRFSWGAFPRAEVGLLRGATGRIADPKEEAGIMTGN